MSCFVNLFRLRCVKFFSYVLLFLKVSEYLVSIYSILIRLMLIMFIIMVFSMFWVWVRLL